jgi:hypothetical protein
MRALETNLPEASEQAFPSVPEAYRSWAGWVGRLDAGGYQVKHAHAARDKAEPDVILSVLCEVYARATFEVALGWHFDVLDSHADEQVRAHIREMFSAEMAEKVRERVGEMGVVVRRRSL